MTELDCIRAEVNKLNARLRREENYQASLNVRQKNHEGPCYCPTTTGDEIGRLQQNLAEIRKELGCTGQSQTATMGCLRYKLKSEKTYRNMVVDVRCILNK